MEIKRTKDMIVFNILSYTFITLAAIGCLLPFLMVISNSFNSEAMVIRHGFSILPREFSTEAYGMILVNWERIVRAYGVTVSVTVVGTIFSLFLSSMFAYVISRKEFKYRNVLSFYVYFTTLFSGGLVSSYIFNVNYLHLKDTLQVLVLVPMFTVFNILILRSFISGSIPDSLPESARLDGAGEFTIFIRVVFPLLKPALATIGLFTALTYWNDWSTAMLYINDHKLHSLQYVLYQMFQNIKAMMIMSEQMMSMPSAELPAETFKLAMTVVVTGPIVLLYPFVQKYFVSGITIGAVKG
ncbi:carbohydrate ABC transporter permease [Paenibacillus sp. YN15]|uniref:carbohydrate ABC transporter permease n=1 Tax=Paenibacillus sp. YN15 TaxID=1742774 RepID=UPI0015EBE39D|nr:carbohydrate ABC transporter permease [Paenibacillus sp. YN15]